ncbi:MAG TPA: Gldg family protein [Rhizomicrobium sp.]|nr:Gldg family protein [Rhizomicrobium sp.]
MSSLSRRTYDILMVVLAAILFVIVNIAADTWLTTAKLDLTENGQFTLAQGTRNIIANLQEPVTLRFYYSKQVAAEYASTAAYAKRVSDLLGEYASLSHGKIIVEEIDPQPYTEAEDQATAQGLTGAPTDSGDIVYFGLVGTNRIDGKEVIPYFSPDREQYIEYDLTSLIYRLSNPKKPQLGIISSLPLQTGPGGMQAMMQGQGQPYAVYSELSQTYAPQMIAADFTAIPKGIDVLMIAHPAALNDAQLQAIDQFALSGGRLLVFVDPNSEIAQAGANPYQPSATPPFSDLPKLFQAWGIGYNTQKIVGDRALAQHVQVGDPRDPVALYPVWLHLTPDNFDSKDPVTANLQSLNLASVGALHPIKGATTTFAPLVSSSAESSLLDAAEVRMNQRPQDLINDIHPTGEKFVIAARVSGDAKTAFPATAHIKSGKINVVVMADSDIFDDRFWVRVQNVLGKKIAAPFADNGAFVMNAVENLMGSSDLISLRTRTASQRPFTVVRDIQANAQAQFQQEEQALQARMTDTQQRLHELEQGGGTRSGAAGLTVAQQAEIERFRRELVDTRTQLRDVQHNLRKDIDALGARLAFINIVLVPLLVAIFAIGLAAFRRRRRARALTL